MGTLCFHSQLSSLVFFCAPLISPLPFTLPIPPLFSPLPFTLPIPPLFSPLPFTLFIPPHFSLLLHFNSSPLHISQPFIPPLPSSSLLFPSHISPFLVSLCLLLSFCSLLFTSLISPLIAPFPLSPPLLLSLLSSLNSSSPLHLFHDTASSPSDSSP